MSRSFSMSEHSCATPVEEDKSGQTQSGCTIQVSVIKNYGRFARVLLLDLPILLAMFVFAAMAWIGHVREQYLLPQYNAAEFSDDRSWSEITYFKRTCDAEDLTTRTGADLFLPYDATADDAYQHNLKHGFTVFRRGLKEDTATALREYIVKRNRELKENEKIFVLEGKNRYSFGLGTEEPTVVAALKEIANSPRLRPALEKVLGPDPALVEMTAITSTYGAISQEWHDDVINAGSAINFGRTFGPIYSLFIQLQNTTALMGATGACPGTHYCSNGEFADFCSKHGFQVANEDGHWGAGDALLMNQNSYHRGAAHTDPNALDRVMFILSFTPKPTRRAETRLMSQGITFSLRWDMWGHTLNDLASADFAMNQPWATLRALGLYKSSSASWGVDYISGATMRMANNEYGFRRQDLEDWLHYGGFGLPQWLEAKVNPWSEEGTWFAYFNETFNLCFKFLTKACVIVVVGYLSIFAVLNFFTSRSKSTLSHASRAVLRLSLMFAFTSLTYYWAKRYVDDTEWAMDIKAGRRYSSTTPLEERAFEFTVKEYMSDTKALRTTLPNKLDVLIETRYGGKELALYNDFINNHPGNEYMMDLVSQQAKTFTQYPPKFRRASAELVINAVESRSGRFLLQNPNGHWIWMPKEDSMRYVHSQLVQASNPLLKELLWTIRLLESDGKYGAYRDTALYWRHSSRYLQKLKDTLRNNYDKKHDISSSAVDIALSKQEIRVDRFRTFSITNLRPSKFQRIELVREHSLDFDFEPIEPTEDAWIATGDEVETWGDNYWYYCTVQNVSAHISYLVVYHDESLEFVAAHAIRRYVEYYVGEEVEVMINNKMYYKGRIRDVSDDGLVFSVYVPELRRLYQNVALSHLRRYGPPKYDPEDETTSYYK